MGKDLDRKVISWQGLIDPDLLTLFNNRSKKKIWPNPTRLPFDTTFWITVLAEECLPEVTCSTARLINPSIMQRQPFVPVPAHSPPLHHPVPQHVSTVPMMRSPPPPASQQQQTNSYGNPYSTGPAQTGGNYGPGFGGFINDPTAQMGFQLGKSAVTAGQDYMEQNVCGCVHIGCFRG